MNLQPFESALQRIRPILLARGFRLDYVERPEAGAGVALAEYFAGEVRLRLVWEGREHALWVESARQAGAQVVSRWQDVEWTVAGHRLPLDQDLSEARIERLESALQRFLAR